jgi:4-diphosphocytidyl-2-C-methyl-D-erythritol kinase
MKTLTLASPAKLNLVLDILGKRKDGFHELRTIFERISLSDRITLTNRTDNKIKVICKHPHVPKGPGNLVVKVAKRLQADFGITQGVTIEIQKNIPVAAGLAGGSSNAATVLQGLNRLWNLKLTQKQLVAYASEIGSDVAFFIYNTSFALGEGRGEKITPIKTKAKLWHVLVTPKVKMLTKEVFGRFSAPGKLKLTTNKDNVSILLPYLRRGVSSGVGTSLSNDLERAILSLRPDFENLKMKLSDAGSIGVCFSGSGPSVFALANSAAHAGQIKAQFDRRFSQVFVVSTL